MTIPSPTNPWLTRRGNSNWHTITDTDKLDLTPRGNVERFQVIEDAIRRGIIRESPSDTFRRAVVEAERAGLVTRPEPIPTRMPFNVPGDALPALASDCVELDSGNEGRARESGNADPNQSND